MGPAIILFTSAVAAAHPHEAPVVERAEASTVQPSPETSPSIHDAEALGAWLEAQGAKEPAPTLLVPVVVRFDEGRLGIQAAWIGLAGDPEEAALHLRLDDSALGISLKDRARTLCPGPSSSCALWLRGTAGPLVPEPVPSELPVLAVREVLETVPAWAKPAVMVVE